VVKDKRVESWDGVPNVDIPRFEAPLNLTDATRQWNMHTQQWLARCCNQRLPQGINTYATYLLSAFWHGERARRLACGSSRTRLRQCPCPRRGTHGVLRCCACPPRSNRPPTLPCVPPGFYPGYYLTFLSAAVAAQAEKAIQNKITTRMVAAGGAVNSAYNIFARVFTNLTMNYFVVPFVVRGGGRVPARLASRVAV